MELENQNAKYIQQLNLNIQTLDKNLHVLEQNVVTINETIKNLARDFAALQRATIEFLKEKEIIKDEEDIKLLQKLHLRHIAALDQEIEGRKRSEDKKRDDI